jgi:phage shock protein A
MNLIDRFIRVAKGNISGVLNSLEAPEKIMNQAMVDMQNDLVKVRQSYAEITAASRRLERQRDAAAQRGQDWYNRAQLALRSGNDTLAKEALYRRQQYLEQVRAIQLQLDTQGKAADKLYQGMQALEVKIQEASQRKNEFIARAKAAESTQKVNDMLSGLTGKTSMDAFRRMEEKVEALEAAAEASAEMASMSTTYLPDGDVSLESEFLLLENSAAVDDEFNKLKTKLLSGSTTSTESRPSKTYTYSESVESDFEKLKKDVQKVPVTVKWD